MKQQKIKACALALLQIVSLFLYFGKAEKGVAEKDALRLTIESRLNIEDSVLEQARKSDFYIDAIAAYFDHDAQDEAEDAFLGYVPLSSPDYIAVFDITNEAFTPYYNSLSEAEWKKAAYGYTLFTLLVPKNHRKTLSKLYIYRNSDTAAFISFDSENSDKHVLGLNVDHMLDETSGKTEKYQLLSLFIHELGHLLVLEKGQIADISCFLSEGKQSFDGFREDSMLKRFHALFWKNAPSWLRDNESGDDTALAAFYEKNKDIFHNSYAASNLDEDFAESFRMFVSTKTPANGSGALTQKSLFFCQFDALIALRAQLLENMLYILQAPDL